MRDFSLKQIEVFVSVVEQGSFTGAAEELFLTQSTISAHVSSLEKSLGAPLFLRQGRHIRLTAEGLRAYPLAKKILSDCQQMSDAVHNQTPEGPLLLGASTVPGHYLLPQWLTAYRKRHKNQLYHLRQGDSSQVHEMLRNDEIRLGFVGAKLDEAGMDYILLAEDQLVMVTENSDYFRQKQATHTLGRALLGLPTVAREEGSGTDRMLQKYMRAISYPRDKLHIVARVDDPETLKRMVRQGAGVSVLSALSVQQEVQDGQFLAFPMDDPPLNRGIYLAYRHGMQFTPGEQQFVDFICKRCRK